MSRPADRPAAREIHQPDVAIAGIVALDERRPFAVVRQLCITPDVLGTIRSDSIPGAIERHELAELLRAALIREDLTVC